MTLDAVGGRASYNLGPPTFRYRYRDKKLKKPTSGKWINVWTKGPDYGSWELQITIATEVVSRVRRSMCDYMAYVGGPYVSQKKADINLELGSQYNHCSVGKMMSCLRECIKKVATTGDARKCVGNTADV